MHNQMTHHAEYRAPLTAANSADHVDPNADFDSVLEAFEASSASPGTAIDRALTKHSVRRITSSDADELAERVPGWKVEHLQLRPGAFTGTLVLINLGPLLIARGMYNQPLLTRMEAPSGCITIGRTGRQSDPVVFHGHVIQPGECIVGGSGGSGELVSRGAHFPTTLSVPVEIWQSGWLDESRLLSMRCMKVQTPGPAWTDTYLEAIEWIIDAFERYPEALERIELHNSLADSLLARVNAFANADAHIAQDRDTRAYRRLAVNRAQEYITENLSDPMRLSDLCKYARTQARSLEYGFREVMGMSPMTYVKTIRLHSVRKLLRSHTARTRSVSEIALDNGFWHLSQFAVDYKHLFGESPSVTSRRTLAQLPRDARRRQSSNTVVRRQPQALAHADA